MSCHGAGSVQTQGSSPCWGDALYRAGQEGPGHIAGSSRVQVLSPGVPGTPWAGTDGGRDTLVFYLEVSNVQMFPTLVNMARWGRAWLWVPSGLSTLTMLSWAQVAGVHSQVLQDLPDGTLDLNELESTVRVGYGSRYHPRSVLICLENTHSSAGGRVLPLAYLREVRLLADCYRLLIHMDGVRLMNAAVAQGVISAQITQHCDSISLCFSKGLGAPAGALVAGCREFVAEAWRVRKLLGGGMRQAGVLAAAARIGLERMEETLQRDHSNARRFTQGIWELGSPICSVDPSAVETNIVLGTVAVPWLSPEKLCERMQAVSEEEVAETGCAVNVRLLPWAARSLRAVWHCDVSAQDTQLAANKLKFVAEQCWRERGAAP
uniref:Aromatic amino acid beta-eliminating lyase/threonine aldolase domain-containing protein n=1 Tax=Chelonoidis abingdonii TaxID=106734 RepID=A0A8C0GAX8_CHEAB